MPASSCRRRSSLPGPRSRSPSLRKLPELKKPPSLLTISLPLGAFTKSCAVRLKPPPVSSSEPVLTNVPLAVNGPLRAPDYGAVVARVVCGQRRPNSANVVYHPFFGDNAVEGQPDTKVNGAGRAGSAPRGAKLTVAGPAPR